jgi:hypothetical protein
MLSACRLVVVLAASVIAACSGTRPMPGSPGCEHPDDGEIYSVLDWRSVLPGQGFTPSVDTLTPEVLGADVNYLAISGGGADGAFGAGFLNGWQETLPTFQVVTGISAGAILATHAFIGDVAPLSVFGRIEESDLVSPNFLPFILKPAYYSNKPLRELMHTLLSTSVLEAVASRAGEGVLAVGVVNLDTGEFVSVDLTKLASLYAGAGTDQDRKRYRNWYIEAVVASAAIPLVMPPSYLSCNMMMDGGLRAQVYMLNTAAAVQAVSGGSTLKVYALMNGTIELHLGESVVQSASKPSVEDIGSRSVKILLNASEHNDLYRLCTGPVAEHVAIVSMDQLEPAVLQACLELEEGAFDGDYMSCVYHAGLTLAAEGGVENANVCASP